MQPALTETFFAQIFEHIEKDDISQKNKLTDDAKELLLNST